tara:strand:- start:112 stop:894 length:783 start_codon:yes stop_codon:yes gene_type:complete
MKFQKNVYTDDPLKCTDNISFGAYYTDQNDEYYVDELGETNYKCKECGHICEALKRVRGECHHGKQGDFYNISCSGVSDCSLCDTEPDCTNKDNKNWCCKCNPELPGVTCANVRCKLNCVPLDSKEAFQAKFKKIQKTVGVSGSEYTMNKAALMVFSGKNSTASNASDRIAQSNVPQRLQTPRTTNSVLSTKLSLRPGAMNPGGKGVDVKHNSYARYLAKKKGSKVYRAQQQNALTGNPNNDIAKHNIVMGYFMKTGCCK